MGEVFTVKITRNTTVKGVPVSAGKVVSVGDIIAEDKKSKQKTQVDEGDIKTLLSLKRAVAAESESDAEVDTTDSEEAAAPGRKGRGRGK